MNEQFSDQIFDSFLTEALCGQSPPDLSARIESAWMREKAEEQAAAGRTTLVKAEIVETNARPECGEAAAGKLRVQVVSHAREANNQGVPFTVNDLATVNHKAEPSISYRRRMIASALGVVAACVLVVLSVQGIIHPRWNGASNAKGMASGSEGNQDARSSEADWTPSRSLANSDRQTARDPRLESGQEEPAGQELNLQDLPFESDQVAASSGATDSWNPSALRVEPLSPEAIVEEIDERLLAMWEQVGVTPTQELPYEMLLARMQGVLLGTPQIRSAAQISSAAQGGSAAQSSTPVQTSRQEIANRIVKTPRFAEVWAQTQTRNWLKRSGLPSDGEDAVWLARSIEKMVARGEPWGQVVSELIGGELGATETPTPSTVFIKAPQSSAPE